MALVVMADVNIAVMWVVVENLVVRISKICDYVIVEFVPTVTERIILIVSLPTDHGVERLIIDESLTTPIILEIARKSRVNVIQHH
jgi:hypothetical protein